MGLDLFPFEETSAAAHSNSPGLHIENQDEESEIGGSSMSL